MKSFVLFCSIVISAMSCSKKAAAPTGGSAAAGSATAPTTGSAAAGSATAPTTGSATVPTTGSATAPATGNAAAALALPKEADIKQGEESWAVYFAVGAVDAKEFVAAKTRTEAMGLTLHHKDRGCDVTPDTTAKDGDMLLSAYYSSEADAKLVATAFGQPAPWVGKVKTMCLD